MRELRLTLACILQDRIGFNWKNIINYLDGLDIEFELVRISQGLGFSYDKVYIDFSNIKAVENRYGGNGDLALYVLLHEIGHMLRIKENDELQTILDGDDFDAYFKTVLVEEEAVHEYALKTFKELTGRDVDDFVIDVQPNIHSRYYKDSMSMIFDRKNKLGGWSNFIDEMVDRDFDWKNLN